MRVLVVSVPRSGTRFYLYFLQQVLGIESEYAHFGLIPDEALEQLIARADVVIVPRRPDKEILESWGEARPQQIRRCISKLHEYMPQLIDSGAHVVDTVKGAHASWQWTEMLEALGVGWSADALAFFDDWPVIGSQFSKPNKRDQLAFSSASASRAQL